MASEGYWLSPSGDIIPVDTSHIDLVIKNPEKFRTTKEEIKKIYKKHEEPVGLEGKAREEIMVDLIRDGWIRIRYVPRKDFFTVQLDKLSERKKNHIYAFASEAVKGIHGVKYHSNSEMKILDLNAQPIEELTLKDAMSFKFKESSVVNIKEYKLEKRFSRILRKVMERI